MLGVTILSLADADADVVDSVSDATEAKDAAFTNCIEGISLGMELRKLLVAVGIVVVVGIGTTAGVVVGGAEAIEVLPLLLVTVAFELELALPPRNWLEVGQLQPRHHWHLLHLQLLLWLLFQHLMQRLWQLLRQLSPVDWPPPACAADELPSTP